MEHNNGGLYAIIDNLSGNIIGPISLFKAAAVAIRMFGDVAAAKDTIIGQHPADFDLYQLGFLDLDNNLVPAKELVLTGQKWLAVTTPAPTPDNAPAIRLASNS